MIHFIIFDFMPMGIWKQKSINISMSVPVGIIWFPRARRRIIRLARAWRRIIWIPITRRRRISRANGISWTASVIWISIIILWISIMCCWSWPIFIVTSTTGGIFWRVPWWIFIPTASSTAWWIPITSWSRSIWCSSWISVFSWSIDAVITRTSSWTFRFPNYWNLISDIDNISKSLKK